MKVGHGENAIAATVESEMSRHFVVITNEIQWQGSAGSLLKRDAFDGQVPAAHPLLRVMLAMARSAADTSH